MRHPQHPAPKNSFFIFHRYYIHIVRKCQHNLDCFQSICLHNLDEDFKYITHRQNFRFFFLYHRLGVSYSRTRARACMEKRLFPVDISSGWLYPAQSDRVLLPRMRRHTRNSCSAARTYCAFVFLPSDCCVYRCLFRLVYAVTDYRKSIPRTFCHRDALS